MPSEIQIDKRAPGDHDHHATPWCDICAGDAIILGTTLDPHHDSATYHASWTQQAPRGLEYRHHANLCDCHANTLTHQWGIELPASYTGPKPWEARRPRAR